MTAYDSVLLDTTTVVRVEGGTPVIDVLRGLARTNKLENVYFVGYIIS